MNVGVASEGTVNVPGVYRLDDGIAASKVDAESSAVTEKLEPALLSDAIGWNVKTRPLNFLIQVSMIVALCGV